jgi:hypothetical protein
MVEAVVIAGAVVGGDGGVLARLGVVAAHEVDAVLHRMGGMVGADVMKWSINPSDSNRWSGISYGAMDSLEGMSSRRNEK